MREQIVVHDNGEWELVLGEQDRLQNFLDRPPVKKDYYHKIIFRFRTKEAREEFNDKIGLERLDRIDKINFPLTGVKLYD